MTYTLPIILVKNLGFEVSEAQCLVAPALAKEVYVRVLSCMFLFGFIVNWESPYDGTLCETGNVMSTIDVGLARRITVFLDIELAYLIR